MTQSGSVRFDQLEVDTRSELVLGFDRELPLDLGPEVGVVKAANNGTVGDVHPNSVVGVDHIVLMGSTPDEISQRCADGGVPIQRIRTADGPLGPMTQLFCRVGPTVLELVSVGEDTPLCLWGITFVSADLNNTVQSWAPWATKPKPAVQPGRSIATLDTMTLNIPTRVAVMSQRVRSHSR